MRLHNSLSKQQHIFSFSYDAFDEILSQDTDCHISLHQYFTFCLYEILLQSTCIHTIRISFWNFHRNVFQHLSHDNIHTPAMTWINCNANERTAQEICIHRERHTERKTKRWVREREQDHFSKACDNITHLLSQFINIIPWKCATFLHYVFTWQKYININFHLCSCHQLETTIE